MMARRFTSGARSTARVLRGIAAVAGCFGLVGAAAAAYQSSVVVTGLDNPRGLEFAPDGSLYIAEAGVASGTSPGIIVRGDTFYATSSGSVSRYANGVTTRIVTGLSSEYDSTTGEVVGPADIVFSGNTARVLIGTGFNPALRSVIGPTGPGLGQLVTIGGGASIDVSSYEVPNNPDHGLLDSDPWRAVAVPGGFVVADAGANALLRVSDAGVVTAIAALPARNIGGPAPSEAVPTGLAVGPDGAYYVGELTGFPFTPGAAQVERITDAGATTTFADGFTMITDLGFGPDGSLYVLQYDDDGLLRPGAFGSLWRVAIDGTRTLLVDDLLQPTAFTIGTDGAFYVSELGAGGVGQVVRLVIPEPATVALMFAGLAVIGSLLRRRSPSRPPAPPVRPA